MTHMFLYSPMSARRRCCTTHAALFSLRSVGPHGIFSDEQSTITVSIPRAKDIWKLFRN